MINPKNDIDALKDRLEYSEYEPTKGIDYNIVNKYPNNSKVTIQRDSDNKIVQYTINNYKIYNENGDEL